MIEMKEMPSFKRLTKLLSLLGSLAQSEEATNLSSPGFVPTVRGEGDGE